MSDWIYDNLDLMVVVLFFAVFVVEVFHFKAAK